MNGTVAIYRREFAGLFFQPLAWILLFLALGVNGLLFTLAVRGAGGDVSGAMAYNLGQSFWFWAILVVLSPLITMRMISEEARSGLLEFLMTAPVTDAAVVLGKLLAATSFFAVLWASVPFYGVVLELLGVGPDWGHILSAYLGSIVLSALFCTIGLFASALTSTPAIAAFIAFVLNVGVLLVPVAKTLLLGVVSNDELVEDTIRIVDAWTRYQSSFVVGALDSAHFAFFLAWIGAFLFATVRLLEARRWR